MSEVDAAIEKAIETLEMEVSAREYVTSDAGREAANNRVKAAASAIRALLTPTISEADVEAGSKALFESHGHDALFEDDDSLQVSYRDDALVVLESVAAARQRAGSGVTGG